MRTGCEAFLRSHLAPGESLLWVGGDRGGGVSGAGIRWIILGLLSTIVLVCVALGVTVPKAVPFLFLGALSAGGAIFMAWVVTQDAGQACYGLTERRVLIRRGVLRAKLLPVDLLDVAEVRLLDHSVSSKTLELVGEVNRALVPGVTAPVRVRGSSHYVVPAGPRLIGLPDADAVRERILTAQRALLPAASARR